VAVSRAEEIWVGFAFFQVMTEESKLFLGRDEKPSFLVVVRGCSCDIQRGVALREVERCGGGRGVETRLGGDGLETSKIDRRGEYDYEASFSGWGDTVVENVILGQNGFDGSGGEFRRGIWPDETAKVCV
jgi:hypothetical protein